MKKIFTFLSIVIFGASMTVSCNLNDNPKFNDKDAFVAFDKATATIKEDGGAIEIPVTLASVKGIAATVSYESVDGTAKVGEDFELVDPQATLTFSAEARTQYVKVKILPKTGLYTGDLKFTLQFKSTGDVKAGAESTCTITIVDNDHPLTFVLGDYKAMGKDNNNKDVEWTMTLKKDPKDINVVWFYNIANLGDWAGDDIMYYGVVSADKKTITLPIGQKSEYKYKGTTPVSFFALTDGGTKYATEGKMVVNIENGGKNLIFDKELGFYCLIEGAGWVGFIMPGITAVKK